MNAVLSLLVLSAVAAEPGDVPQVRGLLVTHVGFAEKDREKVAETVLKLLVSCSSSCPSTAEDFDGVFRLCHLHVKFGKPRDVTVRTSEKVKVDELIISFPTNSGAIWVRSGKEYTYFTKFDYQTCKALHELMKSAEAQ